MVGAFLLVFFRMTGVVLSAPLFSSQSFPMQLRVWTAFCVALVVFPIAWGKVPAGAILTSLEHPFLSILTVATELGLGWLIGFTSSILIWAAQLTGHLVSQEIGFTIGEVFDPVTQSRVSPISQLFFTIALLVFILTGGHHLIVVTLARSFEVAPIGQFPVSYQTGEFVAKELGGEIWKMGLKAALPVMLSLFLVTVAMAILARAVPEMNIFILGFALRIVFGLLALVVILPFVVDLFSVFVQTTQGFLDRLFELWAG